MSDKEIINDLVLYNLKVVAKKFGLVDEVGLSLPENKIVQLLNIAEECSFKPANEDRLLSLLICGVIWENRKETWEGLPSFITSILIRIGLGTTAKMVNWDIQNNIFQSLGSLIDELHATIRLSNHEVTINGSKLVLSDFQKRMWDVITNESRVGISAPTSAGKSFVLINKALEILSKEEGKIVFIVPTISLINQVSSDLRKAAKQHSLNDIYITQTVNDISLFKSSKIIYVLTQERASAALNHPDCDFENLKLLIVDEIQNIEKVANENEQRAQILLNVIQEFKNDKNPEKIIISGPRLSNIDNLVKKWFGRNGKSVSEELPSVVNITYSIKKNKKKLEFRQYLPLEYTNSIEIKDDYELSSKILDKVRFGEHANKFIASLIQKSKDEGNIVFADTTTNANKIALEVANHLDASNIPSLIDLMSFIADTVHRDYSLIKSLEKGIGFHHSKMPQHARAIVEKAFAGKILNTVVSTTTLMQGINLPAKNIIIRNPKVGKDEQLTGYEFTNLKGRAGRLMQDFVGRAFIIDEKQCTDAEIPLNVTQQKELNLGYRERFEKEKTVITEALEKNMPPFAEADNELIVYIRNMCLKYGKGAEKRIKEVGINISETVIDKTIEHLSTLTIPKSICFNNFYWDPILLDDMYVRFLNNEWGIIPNNIVSCANELHALMLKMYQFAPRYFMRYIDIAPTHEKSIGKLQSLCIYAEKYGCGHPLKDVINPPNFPITTSEDIDQRIKDIHTKVVYNIPKLLRPIFNINDTINSQNKSHILSFIEVGGMDVRLRTLIEIGVPRETAIELLQKVKINFQDSDGKINNALLTAFVKEAKNSPNISQWHKILIGDL